MRVLLTITFVLLLTPPGAAHIKDCSVCHILGTDKVPAALKKNPVETCLACHPQRSGPPEHPVGVKPSANTLKLPLFEGKVACPTCHEPHGETTFVKMLRAEEESLCTGCHNK